MANLTETPTYEEGIYRIETTDLVLGGEDGISNIAAKQLANRTAYLKQEQDALKQGNGFESHVLKAANIQLGALKSHMRNVILSCRVSTQGFADFMDESPFENSVLFKASVDQPLVLSAANGYGEDGAMDHYIYLDEDFNAEMAFVPMNSDPVHVGWSVNTTNGTQSFIYTTIPPVYQPFAPSHLNGREWFNTRTQRWQQSNGTAWSAISPRVYTGVVVRSGSGVIEEVINYEIRQEQDPDMVGLIQTYSGNTRPPYGWDWCRGQEVSKWKYPALAALLGSTYGTPSDANNVVLPDLRGEFIRGFDNSAAISDTAFGQKQEAAFPGHSHFLGQQEVEAGTGATVAVAFDASNDIATSLVGVSGLGAGGLRPRNMALNFIIKLY